MSRGFWPFFINCLQRQSIDLNVFGRSQNLAEGVHHERISLIHRLQVIFLLAIIVLVFCRVSSTRCLRN